MATQAISIEALNERFGIPGVAQVVAGSGGLPKVKIGSASAAGEVYLHGAHLTSWVPAGGHEVIFLSDQAQFQGGKAIRGGVPICFPWFNAKADDPKAPSHGFVRTKAWDLESVIHEGNAISVTLSTGNDHTSQTLWPHDFRAVQRLTIGAELQMEFAVTNTGAAPLTFEVALHTYYQVGDVRKVTVTGLDGVSYLDNTDGNREKVQQGDIGFSERLDRAYLNTPSTVVLTDPATARRIVIEKYNSHSTVVWNPWEELTRGMADLGDEEWPHFVCVETANIRANSVGLKPGESHTMTARVRIEGLDQ